MLKLTISALLLIFLLLCIAETKISFSPFKVQFARGWFTLGMILIGIGVCLVWHQGYKDGFRKGVGDTFELLNSKKEKK